MRIRHVLAGTGAGVAICVVMTASPAFAATWSVIPSPAVTPQSALSGIDLVSTTDGWAVGSSQNGGLIERWNGTQLSTVASPDILDHRSPNNSAGLGGVDALSATSAFAVGASASYSFGDGLLHKTAVAERWNGSTWSALAVPNNQIQTELTAVKAFSGTDVWAVGHTGDTVTGTTLALHWNGQSWSLTPTPNVGAIQTFLRDVTAVSTADAWAVGYADDGLGGTMAVVLRWNGQSWSVGPAPALGTLDSVVALSATDVWATGTGTDGKPYLANWRGSGWTVSAAPSGGLPSTTFLGMAAQAPATVWAAGVTADSTTGASATRVVRTTNG